MRISRFYCPGLTNIDDVMLLPTAAHRHAIQVLRLKTNDQLMVFDGQGREFSAELVDVSKRESTIRLLSENKTNNESPLKCTLMQGISRGERMDYTIQKAVELGVQRIVPVMTERCNVSLSGGRAEKKLAHWRGVVISACEQSGRSSLPELTDITAFDALSLTEGQSNFVLDPVAETGFSDVEIKGEVNLFIGPEGGLSESELTSAVSAGFQAVQFGPRILRTETAAVAALAVIQSMAGDLS